MEGGPYSVLYRVERSKVRLRRDDKDDKIGSPRSGTKMSCICAVQGVARRTLQEIMWRLERKYNSKVLYGRTERSQRRLGCAELPAFD